jgi:hypothetical protein
VFIKCASSSEKCHEEWRRRVYLWTASHQPREINSQVSGCWLINNARRCAAAGSRDNDCNDDDNERLTHARSRSTMSIATNYAKRTFNISLVNAEIRRINRPDVTSPIEIVNPESNEPRSLRARAQTLKVQRLGVPSRDFHHAEAAAAAPLESTSQRGTLRAIARFQMLNNFRYFQFPFPRKSSLRCCR